VPRKRFGQNFLIDRAVIDAIVRTIDPQPGETLVEIGPGQGALTVLLIRRLAHLHALEIDRDLIAFLRARHAPETLTIHAGDALAFDFGPLAEAANGALRVVGNLPYNISTPLLFHLMRFAGRIRDMHFMLQREVVERMVATPKSHAYGRLSVMLQYRFSMERLFDVPPECFDPPPAVQSAVIRLVPRPVAELTARDPGILGRVVAAAFGQRRKMLRNTLKDLFHASELEALGILPELRAEALSPADFVRLANYLDAAGRSAQSR
jgi:16S rRNA (adenine1518-N6/adenine1519-N6)-dimethyltransferase